MRSLQNVLFVAPVLLFSVIAHEYAHGYAALRQGDDTALVLGRLTWNPLKHIDPFLTIIMPLIMYFTLGIALGGAKPVPVNPRKYPASRIRRASSGVPVKQWKSPRTPGNFASTARASPTASRQ